MNVAYLPLTALSSPALRSLSVFCVRDIDILLRYTWSKVRDNWPSRRRGRGRGGDANAAKVSVEKAYPTGEATVPLDIGGREGHLCGIHLKSILNIQLLNDKSLGKHRNYASVKCCV